MLTHENLSSNGLTLIDCWRLSSADHAYSTPCLSSIRTGFSWRSMLRALWGDDDLRAKFDPEAVIAALPEATAMMGVPTFYTRLLTIPALIAILYEYAFFVWVRAAARRDAFGLAGATGFAITERYGMTETNMITSNPYEGERRPGSVGFRFRGLAFVSPTSRAGRRFRLAKSGSSRSRGLTSLRVIGGSREKTTQEFRDDGYFITGDLAHVDDWLHRHGRAGQGSGDFRGFNVYPKEVDTEIDALEGVLESAVFGVPHADFGEAVTAAVVARPGATLSESAILGALARRLAQIQGAQTDRPGRISAAQCDGQGAKSGASRSLQGHLSQLVRAWRGGAMLERESCSDPLLSTLA